MDNDESTNHEEPTGQPNRIVSICERLGNHLTHRDLSAIIESKICKTSATGPSSHFKTSRKTSNSTTRGAPTSCVPPAGTDHPLDEPGNDNCKASGSSNASGSNSIDIDTDHSSAPSEHEDSHSTASTSSTMNCSSPDSVDGNWQGIPRLSAKAGKRKNCSHYIGDIPTPKQTKFASTTLLRLCEPQDDPGIRLNMEGYREQLEDILKEMNRGDLLPILNRSEPLLKDFIEEFYANKKPEGGESSQEAENSSTPQQPSDEIPEDEECEVTCAVKLRVKIQFRSHRHLLAGIQSAKNTSEERQMDKFFQATTIMAMRSSIGCMLYTVYFSDVEHLCAFWKDYTTGVLGGILTRYFLRDLVQQAANHEDIDVLVSVDEKDYIEGQKLLVNALGIVGPTDEIHPYPICMYSTFEIEEP